VSQRIAALQRPPALQRSVLVVPVTALMQRIAPPAHLASGLCVATGDTLAPADGRRRLEMAGYVADPEALTEEARLRLEAFAAEEELGAGFALATHDLEIRGAGELLGEEQSGQIQAIGFGLYARLLERTVRALEADEEPDLGLGDDDHPVELHLPALIPDDYVPDVAARLSLYKRIASADDEDGLRALEVELVDRFGLLPGLTAQLFTLARLRLMARSLGIARLELHREGGVLDLGHGAMVDKAVLERLLQGQPEVYACAGDTRVAITLDLPEPQDVVRAAEQLLVRLGARRPQVDLR